MAKATVMAKATKTQKCAGITILVTSFFVLDAIIFFTLILAWPSKPFVYDIKDLTAKERQKVVDALLKMKETPSAYDKNYNAYDYFVELHYRATVPETEIHGSGYLFFPWHREMQNRLHKELRRVSGDPRIPFHIGIGKTKQVQQQLCYQVTLAQKVIILIMWFMMVHLDQKMDDGKFTKS